MPLFDFSKIKKLPPEKRIEALKKLEKELQDLIEERRQEIEEAEKLLEQSEEEMQILLQVETPKSKALKVEDLWERKEKRKEEQDLEKIAREAPVQRETKFDDDVYINNLKQKPINDIYSRITGIYQEVKETGIITADQENALGLFQQALYRKEKDIEHGVYEAGKKTWHQLTASEQIIASLTGEEIIRKHYDRES